MDKAKPFDIPKREVWEAFKKVKANQGAAGEAICPELDEKRKCFAERVKEAATAALAPAAWRYWQAMRRASSRVSR